MADSGKLLAKSLARPVLRPLLARIAYLRERIDSLDRQLTHVAAVQEQQTSRVAESERRVGQSERQVGEILDAVTLQNALARETRREQIRIDEDRVVNLKATWKVQSDLAESLARLERRLEFVRKEVMLEIRYGGDQPGDVEVTEPEILDTSKLENRPLRVNLGCGHIPINDYVNVDGRPLEGVDVVAEVGNLPFQPGELDEIRSSHLLEHFPPPRLSKLLSYWYDLLRPGGTFVAVVPDAEAMIRAFVAGDTPWHELKLVTFGDQEYSGDFHFTMFSESDLLTALASAGFSDVKFVETGRRNGACLEMEVQGYKPSDI